MIKILKQKFLNKHSNEFSVSSLVLKMASKSASHRSSVTSSSSKLPASKQSSSTKYICPICEDVIEDSSPKVKGQKLIFCEGVCNT